MAVSNVIKDVDAELTNCSVCFNSYDEADYLPKFLCCHHTLCLLCVKVGHKLLIQDCLISCHVFFFTNLITILL